MSRGLGDVYKRQEQQLLESCTVVPLMAQQKRLLLADGVRDLVFDPFFPVLDLTWAKMS